jgi:hypothetical protein
MGGFDEDSAGAEIIITTTRRRKMKSCTANKWGRAPGREKKEKYP